MRLQFKKCRYGWGDTFYIYDENDHRKYKVESSILLFNRKFVVRDMNKNKVIVIKNDPKSLIKKKYSAYIDDFERFTITKELSLIPKFTYDGIDWNMQGVMLSEYDMYKDEQLVLTFHQEFTQSGERYILDITHDENELLALAFVLTQTYVFTAEEGTDNTHHL